MSRSDIFHAEEGAVPAIHALDSYEAEVKLLDEKSVPGIKVKQGYAAAPANVLICNFCKGDTFQVLRSDYWTGVRCERCKYQVCIHDG